jgi:ABC-type multidrug transport system fused ATPase/permease subunit
MGPLVSRITRRSSDDNNVQPRNSMILGVNNFAKDFRGPGVSLSCATAQWSRDTGEPTLRDITLTLRPGELLIVIGTVGAGKVNKEESKCVKVHNSRIKAIFD